MKPFRSNCVIVALREKFRDWNNIVLVPIYHGFHFHMMWYDKRKSTFRHFTHSRLDGWFTTLWFKGTVENVKQHHLKRWCESVGVQLNCPSSR